MKTTLALLIAALTAAAAEVPVNDWVKVADAEAEALPFSTVLYLSATGEFFNWGSHGRHRYEGKVNEVRTLAPGKTPAAW